MDILSTLAHEIVHLWQHHFGTPSQKGYHNWEWAAKMLAIGLTPTATGREGGSLTGQHMTRLISENGRFAAAAKALLRAHPAILYQDRAEELQNPARVCKAASENPLYLPPLCASCLGKTQRLASVRKLPGADAGGQLNFVPHRQLGVRRPAVWRRPAACRL